MWERGRKERERKREGVRERERGREGLKELKRKGAKSKRKNKQV